MERNPEKLGKPDPSEKKPRTKDTVRQLGRLAVKGAKR